MRALLCGSCLSWFVKLVGGLCKLTQRVFHGRHFILPYKKENFKLGVTKRHEVQNYHLPYKQPRVPNLNKET